MRSITEEEKKLFRDLISGQFSNLVLLATELDGIETCAIAALNGKEPELMTKPLAVLVNNQIFRKLKSPGETLVAGQMIVLE